ncbi:MAG: arginine--tRNA ligase, partial [Candidatus Parvarchaeota archaeon]|nr:arginine--tRNA ligase [Candidatus Haiyanarchaeum thermophilum]
MELILGTLSQKLREIWGREVRLELTKRAEFGDLFTTIAFQIAKEEGRSAKEVADELIKKIDLKELEFVEKVENANGYINFFLKKSRFVESVLKEVLEKGEAYGSLGKCGKIVVEHTSANPVHPIHIGTLRCAVIGDTLARVLAKAGYEVEVQNYINDLGRQVAILLLGLERYKEKFSGKKFDHYLGSIYIKANAEVEQNPLLEERVREILFELESLTGKYHEMKEKVIPRCVKAMLQTLWKFNIFFDLLVFERDLVKRSILRKTIERMLLSNKVFEVMEGEDKGCLAIDMSDCQALVGDTLKKYKIIRRSDGTITYEGKDIAYQFWKFGIITGLCFSPFARQPNKKLLLASDSGKIEGEREVDRVINVVGFEQKYSQLVVFNALRILGFEREFRNSVHLPFEWVCFEKEGEVGKISGRKSHLLEYSADFLLEKVYEAAKQEVLKKNPNANEKVVDQVAKKIAVGAIRFYLLK